MSDNDLIRRGEVLEVLKALPVFNPTESDGMTAKAVSIIHKATKAVCALPAVHPQVRMKKAVLELPEIKALVKASEHIMRNYLEDELDEPDLCVDDEHWQSIHALDTALRDLEGYP